jgi:Uma2 family endonuclease
MSSVTNPPPMGPPPTFGDSPRRVPTLDELQAMTSEPDQRVVIRDVDWAFYEQLVDSIPEGMHIQVDFDGKDVEIMVLGPFHDGAKKLLGQFVERVAEECEIPYKSAGQTTWKRPDVKRGVEADESYFFRVNKLAMIAAARSRNSRDVADYPNPDLGIEVDESPSKIDRPGIYAALRVAEVWRFDGEQVFIDRSGEDEQYHPAPDSQFLPVKAEDVTRWVVEEDTSDESAWARRLRAWVRAEVAPRPRPGG